MKTWKKAMALVLSAGFVFGATACKTDVEKMSHVEHMEAMASALSDVKSAKLALDMQMEIDMPSGIGMMSTDASSTMKIKLDIGGEIVVTEKNEGMDAFATIELGVDYGGMNVKYKPEFYVIDGYGYMKDMEGNENTYYRTDGSLTDMLLSEMEMGDEELAMFDMLGGVLESFDTSEIPVGLFTELPASDSLFAPKMSASKNAYTITYDYKAVIDAIVGYVKSATVDTTVGNAVNFVLGNLEKDLTYEKLLDEIGAVGSLTLPEAYAQVNAALAQAFGEGVSLQSIKNTLLDNEQIVALITAQGVDANALNAIKAIELDTLVNDYKALTVNDLIARVAEEEYFAIKTYTDQAKAWLSSEKLFEDAETLAEVQATLGGFTFNEYKMTLRTNYSGKKVKGFDFGYIVDADMTQEEMTVGAKMSMNLGVSDLSASAVTVALPEGAQIEIMSDTDLGLGV